MEKSNHSSKSEFKFSISDKLKKAEEKKAAEKEGNTTPPSETLKPIQETPEEMNILATQASLELPKEPTKIKIDLGATVEPDNKRLETQFLPRPDSVSLENLEQTVHDEKTPIPYWLKPNRCNAVPAHRQDAHGVLRSTFSAESFQAACGNPMLFLGLPFIE